MGRTSRRGRKHERRQTSPALAKPLPHAPFAALGVVRPVERHLNVPVVYRFFNDPSYADALAAGKVWLSTLETCRRYEDPRQGDPEEGFVRYNSGYAVGISGDKDIQRIATRSGIYISPGFTNVTLNNNTAVQHLRDAFVLCTTELFDRNTLSETFGMYCVAISDPRHFFALVTNQLRRIYNVTEAYYGRVIYKDRFYTGLQQPPGPIGFVKPPDKYKDQHEVRFLWLVKEPAKLEPFLLVVPDSTALCKRVA